MKINKKLVSELISDFTKLVNKFNRLEKKPVDFGTNEKLFPSEIHTIEVIGKHNDITVTQLCEIFGITKGAVSQVITKLEEKGYVTKKRNSEYAKEKNISLTSMGKKAFRGHENLHDKMDSEFLKNFGNISMEEIIKFKNILSIIGDYIDKYYNLD